MRAGLYARVSSKEQVEGYSIAAQLHALRALAESRGWEVVGEYVDEGKSARSEDVRKRPQFKAMMDDALSGKLDIVAVHKLDRFSRNLRLTLEYFERLSKVGVTFLSISEQMDFSQPWGKFALAMLGGLAQFYSENLGLETKKGKAERKAQGLYLGLLPFGMMKGDNGVPVANRETLPGLQMAFELSAQGKSDREVAQALNAAGYRTAGNQGSRPFSKDTVRDLLQNHFYLGELPDGSGGWLKGKHEAVLDESLFYSAQKAREERRRVPKTINVAARTYSLSGLMSCAICGARVRVHKNEKGRARVYCSGRAQGAGCTYRGTFLEVYERQIEAYLQNFAIPEDYQSKILEAYDRLTIGYSHSTSSKTALEERLRRLQQLFQWGDLSEKEYVAQRDSIRRELASRDSVHETKIRLEKLAEFLGNVASAWGVADQEQRNRLARLLFEGIQVKDDEVVALKPRPELEPFFRLSYECHRKSIAGDPEGLRTLDPSWRAVALPWLGPTSVPRICSPCGCGSAC